MRKNFNVHPIQSGILLTLLFKTEARFSQLNKMKVPSDQLNFHVKKLINDGFIEKTEKGSYQLSVSGKEFANRFDTDQKIIERQAKIGVLICGVRKKLGKAQYLLQQRLKQPYFGLWGFITGKVRWGESIFETAKRELKEETNLEANLELAGIKHKTDYGFEGVLLEDKFFFVLRATKLRGRLKRSFEGGKNAWIDKKEIMNIKDLFGDVGETLKIAEGKNIVFSEFKFRVKKY